MSFTGYEFVLVFLPIVLGGAALLSRFGLTDCKKLWLVAASVVFYVWASPAALAWLLVSAAVSYALSLALCRTPSERVAARKLLVGAGCLFHVLFLGFFKYVDLGALAEQTGNFGALVFLVPMGVSFFTFQFIVFLLEVYRGKDAPSKPLDFLLYSTFFVYRTMGPIMTHSDFRTQMESPDALRPTSEEFARGIYQFVLGLTKKLVLADTVAVIANNGFSRGGQVGLFVAWGAALAYTFQLYFDFSGYSDMAIGIGRMLGVRLPQNFDSPYKSESVSVFWRRWHMTLGRALTTCVYISLGGNRRGLPRTCLNLFLVMVVSGIWHGDTVNFLIWGAAYGLILVFERLCEQPLLSKIPTWIRRVLTFLVVTLLWVPFRAATLNGTMRIWRGMLNFKNLGINQFAALAQDGIIHFPTPVALLYGTGLILLCALIAFIPKNSHEKTEAMRFDTKTALILAFLIFFCLIHMSRAGVFLYENF